ncbi:3'(2'),5'-bisphosphate nucleotidase CysQ [Pseudovibrio japonicus]|uniref:3'(2'),5'-bisphosphate nucleotidase CysQ n=1 Tax=Pseudovibrio japonicus TaxID=366534 RepID=A0ABQ3E2Y4_9HYPH|nr:3'(2'),5'-bisphosphate nucleotidase CysQ [Pseudovibrio japonicus]GHB24614.1 3'(2'),5'-bisphosphate nucleotidase CysQ [Pseudovibrio japonicus]
MLNIFKNSAHAAGCEILRIYETEFATMEKDDGSPVTRADEAAEKVILQNLSEAFPEIPVIAEEEVAAGRIPVIGDRFILVDPLDGTREFINRNGEFTVNIALIENGAPVYGVVYAPALRKIYWGAKGEGAFMAEVTNDAIGPAHPISCRPAPKAVIVFGSRSHMSQATQKIVDRCDGAKMVSAGSSLKFCRVAEGKADLYPRLGRTMEWDTAAGHAVVLAAGGKVIVEGGAPLAYGKQNQVSDSDYANPHFMVVGDESMISQYGLSSNW